MAQASAHQQKGRRDAQSVRLIPLARLTEARRANTTSACYFGRELTYVKIAEGWKEKNHDTNDNPDHGSQIGEAHPGDAVNDSQRTKGCFNCGSGV